jgi:protein gp37
MGDTTIPWATKSWNPVVGCTPVSAGCDHCFAKRIYERFHPGRSFAEVHTIEARLEETPHWRKPQRVFVDSMSDLFHPDVPDEFIDRVFDIICRERKWGHTFIILTKRAQRMMNYILGARERLAKIVGSWLLIDTIPGQGVPDFHPWPLPNVWLGVTAENQEMADARIPLLLKTPAAVRFVSIEPALGPVDLGRYLCQTWRHGLTLGNYLDWVIMGCESGPGRRPMNIMWARSVRDQCQAVGVPFFLKQAEIDGKLVKMPELDGKVWAEFPA